jgi:hypothetical protein
MAVAALPVVDWFNVGTSAATSARNTATPDEPLGVARNKFADPDAHDSAIVPDVVTGVPEADIPAAGVTATLVTVPEPPDPPLGRMTTLCARIDCAAIRRTAANRNALFTNTSSPSLSLRIPFR